MASGPPPSYAETAQEGCYNPGYNPGYGPGPSTYPAYPTGPEKNTGPPNAYGGPPNVYHPGSGYAPTYAPQHTTQQVVVGGMGQPVIVAQIQPAPQNYMCLSIMVCFFCNCLFGLIAMVFSSASSDAANQGRMEEARSKAKTALIINLVGVVITVMAGVAIVIIISSSNTYYGY